MYWVGKDGKNQLLRYDDEENLNFVQTNDLIWNFGDIDETTIPDSRKMLFLDQPLNLYITTSIYMFSVTSRLH